jgi:hypothetical protein
VQAAWPKRILAVLLVVGLFAVTRLPSIRYAPLSNDESIHSAAAVRCAHLGQLPYVGAVSNKGPLQYWTYQAVFHFAGDYDMRAIHMAGAFIVGMDVLLVWGVASAVFGRRAGPLASVIYLVVMASDQSFLSFNAALPASLPLLGAAWIVLAAKQRLSPVRCLAAGALVMTAAGYRQNCLMIYPILCGGTMLLDYAECRRFWPALARGGFVGLGGLLPAGVVVAIYASHGALGALHLGYLGYNTEYYLKAVPFTFARVFQAVRDWAAWLNGTSLVTLLAIVGVAPIVWRLHVNGGTEAVLVPRGRGWLLIVLTAALWYAPTVGWRFYPHYRMIELPFSAIMAAGGWLFVETQLRGARAHRVFRLAAAVALTALLLAGDSWDYLVAYAARRHAPIAAAGHVQRVAMELRRATTPDDTLFVWGLQPPIYLLAQRRMASRFANCCPLIGLVQSENYVPEDQDRSAWVLPGGGEQMMADLRAEPPAYFVDASQDVNFIKGRYPVDTYPQLAEWLQDNYVYDFEVAGADNSTLIVYRQRRAAAPAQP